MYNVNLIIELFFSLFHSHYIYIYIYIDIHGIKISYYSKLS
jgi:hypothetical protein